MYSFTNDYSEGAHPKIMKALIETNDEQCAGYGLDKYCLEATRLLKRQLQNDNVDIHYLVGGTQTNAVFISSVLRPYQAVIAADSGHINVHETGAIEATGHKVLTRPHQDGKLTVAMIESIIEEHSDEHMVQPKMVYISQSTEYGSVYSLDELKDIATLCKKKELYLFVDGARLGSALALPDTPTFKDLADYSDAFYIGGTKMDNLELVSFQIISAVGVAKSFYIEAMKIAEKGDFDLAKAKIKEGDQEFVKGHEAHAGLIQKEANGEKVVPNILLMHAEDQLMSAETIKMMALEIIKLNQRLYSLEK